MVRRVRAGRVSPLEPSGSQRLLDGPTLSCGWQQQEGTRAGPGQRVSPYPKPWWLVNEQERFKGHHLEAAPARNILSTPKCRPGATQEASLTASQHVLAEGRTDALESRSQEAGVGGAPGWEVGREPGSSGDQTPTALT